MDQSNAGIFLVVVGSALLALLVAARRATGGILREAWGRMGLLRWVFVLIILVIFYDLADGAANR